MKSRNLYIFAIITCLLDQLTKHQISSSLSLGASKPLGSLMQLTLVHNYGGAFGVLRSNTVVLSLVTCGVIAAIISFSRKHSTVPLIVGIALSQALGGALGNLIDRVRLGYVVDFLDFRVWPVFNIADIAVTGGVILLAYHLLFNKNPMTVKES